MKESIIIPVILIGVLVAACSPMTAGNTGSGAAGSIQSVPVTGTASPQAAAITAVSRSSLGDLGPAPELQNQVWLNTDHPLRLKDLRGKVVLLEMWTFDCINCQHTIPSLRGWYQQYSPKGLVIIGNHFPEFGYEKDLSNLKEAIQRLDIPYPVAQDNDGKTWNAYNNRYWPTAYLIDKRGHIRFIQIGEGNYDRTAAAIQDLLFETYTQ